MVRHALRGQGGSRKIHGGFFFVVLYLLFRSLFFDFGTSVLLNNSLNYGISRVRRKDTKLRVTRSINEKTQKIAQSSDPAGGHSSVRRKTKGDGVHDDDGTMSYGHANVIGFAILSGCRRFNILPEQIRTLRKAGVARDDLYLFLSRCLPPIIYESLSGSTCDEVALSVQVLSFYKNEHIERCIGTFQNGPVQNGSEPNSAGTLWKKKTGKNVDLVYVWHNVTNPRSRCENRSEHQPSPGGLRGGPGLPGPGGGRIIGPELASESDSNVAPSLSRSCTTSGSRYRSEHPGNFSTSNPGNFSTSNPGNFSTNNPGNFSTGQSFIGPQGGDHETLFPILHRKFSPKASRHNVSRISRRSKSNLKFSGAPEDVFPQSRVASDLLDEGFPEGNLLEESLPEGDFFWRSRLVVREYADLWATDENFRLYTFYMWMWGFMFSKYEFAVFLEDDLLLSPALIPFFKIGRDVMQKDVTVFGVSGWNDNAKEISKQISPSRLVQSLPDGHINRGLDVPNGIANGIAIGSGNNLDGGEKSNSVFLGLDPIQNVASDRLYILRQNHFGGLGWLTSRLVFRKVFLHFFVFQDVPKYDYIGDVKDNWPSWDSIMGFLLDKVQVLPEKVSQDLIQVPVSNRITNTESMFKYQTSDGGLSQTSDGASRVGGSQSQTESQTESQTVSKIFARPSNTSEGSLKYSSTKTNGSLTFGDDMILNKTNEPLGKDRISDMNHAMMLNKTNNCGPALDFPDTWITPRGQQSLVRVRKHCEKFGKLSWHSFYHLTKTKHQLDVSDVSGDVNIFSSFSNRISDGSRNGRGVSGDNHDNRSQRRPHVSSHEFRLDGPDSAESKRNAENLVSRPHVVSEIQPQRMSFLYPSTSLVYHVITDTTTSLNALEKMRLSSLMVWSRDDAGESCSGNRGRDSCWPHPSQLVSKNYDREYLPKYVLDLNLNFNLSSWCVRHRKSLWGISNEIHDLGDDFHGHGREPREGLADDNNLIHNHTDNKGDPFKIIGAFGVTIHCLPSCLSDVDFSNLGWAYVPNSFPGYIGHGYGYTPRQSYKGTLLLFHNQTGHWIVAFYSPFYSTVCERRSSRSPCEFV